MTTRNGRRRLNVELNPDDEAALEAVKAAYGFETLRATIRYCLQLGHDKAKAAPKTRTSDPAPFFGGHSAQFLAARGSDDRD
jgi:hypothetical protein